MSKASAEVAEQERRMLEDLGRRMRRRRNALSGSGAKGELGIVELGERAGLSHSYVSRLERGLVPRPTLPELAAVARALEMSPQALLYGDMDETEEADVRRILRHDDLREMFATIAEAWDFLPDRDRQFLLNTLRVQAEHAKASTLAGKRA